MGNTNNISDDREKVMKLDAQQREYDIVVIGEEPHLAYNRVGLTSFFQHRKVENLYLNPRDWVSHLDIFLLLGTYFRVWKTDLLVTCSIQAFLKAH